MSETTKLKLIFMGTPDFSVLALDALLQAGHEVVCVYSQPPRKSGRGQKFRPSAVHAFAESKGIEVRTPVSLKDVEEQKSFAALKADVAVVVAYGLILPTPILDAPPFGMCQYSRQPFAPVAGGCAHSTGHRSRGSGKRRHHHANGCRP